MKNIRVIALISVLALLVMTAGGASSRGAGPLETNAPTGTVAAAISYQGRLVHPTTGAPLSGTYDLEFTVWSADWPGGAQLGGVITKNSQSIVNGLYSTQLAADPTIVNGQEMWLQIRVRTTGGTWETLTPRVQVLPTAYAMSLRPGARIEGSLGRPQSVVAATNTSHGFGLRGESRDAGGYGVYGYNGSANAWSYGAGIIGSVLASGYGVVGTTDSGHGIGVQGITDDGYGVYGLDFGSDQARGYGGYFYSSNGVGVYGLSNANSYYSNMYAPGVYGKSAYGAGVYGVGTGTASPAYGGVFEGRSGVYARGTGSDAQLGYAGYFVSQNYRGIYAISQGGWYDGYFGGIGGVYSAGGYFSLYANRTLVANSGDETLEPGDVVAIAGVANPLITGGEPLLAVRQASGATDTAVIGVVVQAMRVQEVERPENPTGHKSVDVQPVEGSIPPGGYLAIVSHGLAPAVKVNVQAAESLRVGEPLTSSTVPGRAEIRRADGQSAYLSGTILGKVAGPFDPKTGTVPVFVTLQ